MKNSILVIGLVLLAIRFASSQCMLPNEFPTNSLDLEQANRVISECYAPNIRQMAKTTNTKSLGGRADLLASIFYDGDEDITNNWENLDQWEISEITPHVYYSVVWTEHRWIISYAFYHPRDYAPIIPIPPFTEDACCIDNHEHDLEGVIVVVNRTSGNVNAIATMYHNEIYYDFLDESNTPDVFIDNSTHAIRINQMGECMDEEIYSIGPCDDCIVFTESNHILYSFDNNNVNVNIQQNGNLLTGTANYQLEDIFGSHSNSLGNLRLNNNYFNGSLFVSEGTSGCQDEGQANAPWGWSQFFYTTNEIETLICGTNFAGTYAVGQSVFQAYFNAQGPLYQFCLLNNLDNDVIIHNPYFPPECGGTIGQSITIVGTVDWNFPESIPFQNIILSEDAVLNVDGKQIKFVEGGLIKLNEGSTLNLSLCLLYPCDTDKKWNGIISTKGGKINMFHAWIHDAKKGLQLGESNNSSSINNNKLFMDVNSNFIRCNIGLEIGGGIVDAKISGYSDFLYCDIGILAIQSSGLILDQVLFSNNTESIRAIDSYIHVRDGNTFEDGEIGISVEGTFPGSTGIDIGNMGYGYNSFSNMENGIVCIGAEHQVGANIVNCRFTDITQSATSFLGSNQYMYYNNTVESTPNGVFALATGTNSNETRCNLFDNISNVDNLYMFNNYNSQFLENHSIGNHNVNYALLSANMADNIGSPNEAAGNCFSDHGDDILTAPFWFFGPGNSFYYHYFDDSQTTACQEPINDGNYEIIKSDLESKHCDGIIGIFNLIDPDGDGVDGFVSDIENPPVCTYHIPQENVMAMIIKWINIVIDEEGDDPRTHLDESQYPLPVKTFNSENILDQWIRYAIYRGLDEADFAFIESVLAPLQKWKWRKQYFGICMIQGDYDKARNVLDLMPSRNEEEIYFKEVQKINLKRFDKKELQNWITENDLNYLKTVAESFNPSSGYARSLYRLLTGINLPFDIPDINEYKQYASPRNASEYNKNMEKQGAMIFPNPTSGEIHIYTKKAISIIAVLDFTGKKILEHNSLEKEAKMDVKGLNRGLYVLALSFQDGTKEILRFVKK